MNKERIDIHAPSKIIPADYDYVAQEAIKGEGLETLEIIEAHREKIQAHMKVTGGNYSGHEHGGMCMVCGSVNAIYTALFYHAKTNTYVRMGTDCAGKCGMGHADAFKSFRAAVTDAIKNKAGKAKAQVLLAGKGLSGAWVVYLEPMVEGVATPYEESTISNMVGKLVQYGNLSEKQYAFLGILLQKITNRAADKAKRDAEKALAKDCPDGRIIIKGKILTVKLQETQFGSFYKMLVQSVDGFKVWGTIPSSLQADRGDMVEFTATVTPSADDKKFGFFKRPTNATVLAIKDGA